MAGLGYRAIYTKGKCITVTVDGGQTSTTSVDAKNFEALLEAVINKAPKEEVLLLLTPVEQFKSVGKAAGFEIRINADTDALGVFWEGREVHSKITDLISTMYSAGHDFKPLRNFMIKAMSNKALERVDILYDFVTKNALPLHEDGDFLAFKTVRSDGYDKHSGTVLYKIGQFIEPKNGVDWNELHQCSQGLHIGGRGYVSHFGNSGDRYFVVKVNPKDCIYYVDHNSGMNSDGKMRVARLFVYAETAGGEQLMAALPSLVTTIPEADALEKRALDREAAIKQAAKTPAGLAKVKRKLAKADKKAEKAKAPKVAAAPPVRSRKAKASPAPAVPATKFVTKDNRFFTKRQITDAMDKAGSQNGAARLLGVSRTSLQEWLRIIFGQAARKR